MADDTTDATTDTTDIDDSTSIETSESDITDFTTIGSPTVGFYNLFEYYYAEEVDRHLWKEIATGDIYSKEAAIAIYKKAAKFRHGAVVYYSEKDADYKVEFPNQFLNPYAESETYCATWWIILNVSEDANVNEIKEAYSRMFASPGHTSGTDDTSVTGVRALLFNGWDAYCFFTVECHFAYKCVDAYPWIYHVCSFPTRDDAWVYTQKTYKNGKKCGIRFNTEEQEEAYEDFLEACAMAYGIDNIDFQTFRRYGVCRAPGTASGVMGKSGGGKSGGGGSGDDGYGDWLAKLNKWLRKHGYDGSMAR